MNNRSPQYLEQDGKNVNKNTLKVEVDVQLSNTFLLTLKENQQVVRLKLAKIQLCTYRILSAFFRFSNVCCPSKSQFYGK